MVAAEVGTMNAMTIKQAMVVAAAKAGLDSRAIAAVEMWVTEFDTDTGRKARLTVDGGSDEVNRRAKQFAVKWLARHYPEAKFFHAKKGTKRVWFTYFDSSYPWPKGIARGVEWYCSEVAA
jgi:hypothetical protein